MEEAHGDEEIQLKIRGLVNQIMGNEEENIWKRPLSCGQLDGDCALLWKRIKPGEDQLQEFG
jgi:hypothetical protein